MRIPVRTLARWKKASKDDGMWTGADGDCSMARPAKRKTVPGSGGHNRKVTAVLKRKIKQKLRSYPFLTWARL